MAEMLVRLAAHPVASVGVMFTGLSRAWPERPARTYARRGSKMTMIPGISGGAFIPGRTVHQDYGSHESAGAFEVSCPYADEALLSAIAAVYADPQGTLTYTHDWTGADWNTAGANYTNLWMVVWDEGTPFVPEANAGFPGTYKVKMKFKIIMKIA